MTDAQGIRERLEQGLEFFVDGRHAEAYDEAIAVAEQVPAEPRVWDLVGAITLEGGRPELAYEAFARRRELAEDRATLLNLANAAYHALDLETAQRHALEAAEQWPDDPEVRAWRAKLEGITDAHHLLLDVGTTLYRQGRIDEALDVLVAALETRDSAETRLWTGRALLASGDHAGAVVMLQPIVSMFADDPTVAVDLATAFAGGGRRDIARAYLVEARRIHPNDPEVLESLARLDLDEGAYESALGFAHAATEAAPASASAWTTAAGAFEASGRREEARLAADRAIALAPARAEAWAIGARVLDALGDAALAARYAAAAREAGMPGVASGHGFPPRGDLQADVSALYAIVQARPAWNLAYRDRATIERLLGEYDRALYYLDLVARDLVSRPEPHLLTERGGILLALGRTADAAEAFRQALALDVGFASARAGLDEVERTLAASAPMAPPPLDVSGAAASPGAPAAPGASASAAPPAPASAAPAPVPTAAPPATYCVRCGTALPQQAAFCPECGTRRV